MIVDRETKISKLTEENSKAINAIASINKQFKKLKNPVLRKLLAPRVNVALAAQIGNTSVNTMLKALEDIGFQVNYEESDALEENNTVTIKEKNKVMKKAIIIEMDVRPILSSGVDPFKAIMDKLKTIGQEETLCIINTFEPIPLLNILKDKGYEYESERSEDGTVKTYLEKSGVKKTTQLEAEPISKPELSFEDIELKYEGNLIDVDVRDLEMPLPMVTILEAIEKLEANQALFVHHKRLPQYLMPELESREYVFASKEIDPSNLKLIIYKK